MIFGFAVVVISGFFCFRPSAPRAISMIAPSKIQLFNVDTYGEFRHDVPALYEYVSRTETVRDDAIFWSLGLEKVWVGFALRQRLEFAAGDRGPAYVSADDHALYIMLDRFPPEALKDIVSLDYFSKLLTHFPAVEIGFSWREKALMGIVFPAQTIPCDWRRVTLRSERQKKTIRVSKYDMCYDVEVEVVRHPCLIEYNVDQPPL